MYNIRMKIWKIVKWKRIDFTKACWPHMLVWAEKKTHFEPFSSFFPRNRTILKSSNVFLVVFEYAGRCLFNGKKAVRKEMCYPFKCPQKKFKIRFDSNKQRPYVPICPSIFIINLNSLGKLSNSTIDPHIFITFFHIFRWITTSGRSEVFKNALRAVCKTGARTCRSSDQLRVANANYWRRLVYPMIYYHMTRKNHVSVVYFQRLTRFSSDWNNPGFF